MLGTNQINKQTSYYNESNLPHDIHSNHTLFLDSVYRNISWKWVSTNRMYIDTAQYQDAEERTFCLHTEIHHTQHLTSLLRLPPHRLPHHTHSPTSSHGSSHDLQHRWYKSKDYRDRLYKAGHWARYVAQSATYVAAVVGHDMLRSQPRMICGHCCSSMPMPVKWICKRCDILHNLKAWCRPTKHHKCSQSEITALTKSDTYVAAVVQCLYQLNQLVTVSIFFITSKPGAGLQRHHKFSQRWNNCPYKHWYGYSMWRF